MTTTGPFGEAVDIVCAVLQCKKKDVAERWGKTPQHISGLISAEKKGARVNAKTFKSFTNEFAVELDGAKQGTPGRDKLFGKMVELMLRNQAYIKVLTEELAYMKVKMTRRQDGDNISALYKEELDYLANRGREEAEQLLREWKV